jgi:hypothetical protein
LLVALPLGRFPEAVAAAEAAVAEPLMETGLQWLWKFVRAAVRALR